MGVDAGVDSVRRRTARVLRAHKLGDELRDSDFALVRGLLEHHPDKDAKVGAGVRAIRVDASLHESNSSCFWVLRMDGTSEDFSVRKCLEGLRRRFRLASG